MPTAAIPRRWGPAGLRFAAVAVAVALAVPLSLPAQGAAPRPMSLDDLMELRSVGSPALSPDGARVVYAVTAWEHPAARDTSKGDRHDQRSHLWMVPAAGGTPRQITFGERGESQPQWSPDGRFIAFIAARGPLPCGPLGGAEGWTAISAIQSKGDGRLSGLQGVVGHPVAGLGAAGSRRVGLRGGAV